MHSPSEKSNAASAPVVREAPPEAPPSAPPRVISATQSCLAPWHNIPRYSFRSPDLPPVIYGPPSGIGRRQPPDNSPRSCRSLAILFIKAKLGPFFAKTPDLWHQRHLQIAAFGKKQQSSLRDRQNREPLYIKNDGRGLFGIQSTFFSSPFKIFLQKDRHLPIRYIGAPVLFSSFRYPAPNPLLPGNRRLSNPPSWGLCGKIPAPSQFFYLFSRKIKHHAHQPAGLSSLLCQFVLGMCLPPGINHFFYNRKFLEIAAISMAFAICCFIRTGRVRIPRSISPGIKRAHDSAERFPLSLWAIPDLYPLCGQSPHRR